MNARRFTLISIAILVIAGLTFGMARYAFADHDIGVFELDRNAQDGAAPGDDWDTLAGGGGSADAFTGILVDIGGTGTQFHGGGSKDNNDIDEWLWNPGEPLDKDDITNAYAAAYIDPDDGDLIIYHGLDRYANNGSAQIGFWFFQNPIGLTNIPRSGGFEFSGVHAVGDLLIQSNFTQGGVVDSVSVFEWVGSGGSNGSLDLVFSAQDCATAPASDPACATVNQADTPAPWAYTPKFGSAGTFPQGSFFEGGVNVSELVPDAGCFSGFLAETRTSTPFDSRLKDFAMGSLSLCHIEGTKYLDVNGNGTRDVGEPPLEDWEIQLSGDASLTTYTDAQGEYKFDDLGNGSYTVTEVCPAETPAWVQTEPGASLADACGDETYSFNINLGNIIGIGDFGNGAPAVDVTKVCSAVVEVGGMIDYDLDVTNTGNVNLVNVDVTDAILSFDNNPNVSLIPAGTQHYDVQTTAPSSAQTITNTVNASGDFGSTSVFATVSDSANCTTYVVDARISITPSATNEVGDAHIFTVYAEKNEGQGAGWVAAADGTIVTVTLTDSNGASSIVSTDTCATGTVGGYCSVTFTSNSAGQTTGHASASILSGGLSLSRQTNGLAGNSDDAVKTWVDAYITIAADDTNEVGDPHTFTVTVYEDDGSGAGFVAAAGEHVDFTLTDSNGAASVLNSASSTCDDAGANTDASGQCTIVFTSNSAGEVTGHASSNISVGGLSLFRETDGTAPNSDDTVKTFVDAYITIAADATNEVGAPHTFTVTVYEDDGSGSGFQPAAGEDVDFTLTNANGAAFVLDAGNSTCNDAGANTDANGECTIVFTSNSAGEVTGHASSNISVGGLSLFRETDGTAPNSDDAVKAFVDAYITIAADATNEVGDPHTFTVTVYEDDGSGAGFVAAAGEHVDFTLTDSLGAASVLNGASSTCDDAGANTNASGQCTIVFTSNSAGQVTGHASSSVSVGGLSLSRETDGVAPNSGDAVKTFVDARISITPDGTNGIGEDHTFTVLIEKNEGDGSGWVPADDGTTVSVTLTDAGGASASVSSEDCSTGTTNGLCSVTFSSLTSGTTTGHASATILSGGLNLVRETDGLAGNSGDAVKTWIDGSLSWLKHDSTGSLLGGATFEVCRTFDRFGNDIPDECVTVLDNSAPDADPDDGEFLLVGLLLGTYTIEETVPPAGYSGDSFVDTVLLTLAFPDQSATHIWVNNPVNLGCTPGFWQGGTGKWLWDVPQDMDWFNAGYATQYNPYDHNTLFNSFFSTTTDPDLAGFTMYALVSTGGGSNSDQRAARDMVAAYLNESAFPADYPATSLADLEAMWYAAVAGGDAALDAFHSLVDGWNSPELPGYCPLP
jgi:uncharacterized repeat protein (TIGR01451 family)